MATLSGFRRDRLPSPVDYYTGMARLRLLGRGTWRSTVCPFHEDTRPSLRVNVDSGAYRCMACGAKGRDVLAFHRSRHGLSFVAAAQALGAWGAL